MNIALQKTLSFSNKTVFMALLATLLMPTQILAAPEGTENDGALPKSGTPMNNQRLEELIYRLDEDASGRPGFWQFAVENRIVTVITDENHDRMRILSPVVPADDIEAEILIRLMQANFDSALDARYAIARNIVWSAFIHPLSTLNDFEILNAIGQVVNLTITYGKSYSSGLLIFQGGDSQEQLERRKLIDDLLEKGLEI